MDTATRRTIDLARTIGRRGLAIAGIEVHTPDGRAWAIDANPRGGFRLFEIDKDDRVGPEEHDAVEGEFWEAADLADYLAAVGARKARPD
ncbi:MAG: hypothetical protein HBSAPP03_16070 [Phycisphaerae bacterium]|nr:MAG: hypothetical protein HBSAPP03_16070 [Phycisphaerae bacterium]